VFTIHVQVLAILGSVAYLCGAKLGLLKACRRIHSTSSADSILSQINSFHILSPLSFFVRLQLIPFITHTYISITCCQVITNWT